MATRPVSRPPAPFQAPMSGSIDERLSIMATEINRKMNAGLAGPAYSFLGLIAPDGSAYRLTVDNAGVLHTELTPRS